MTTVRPARPGDGRTWLQLRRALWPEGSEVEHREEIDRFFAGQFPHGPWTALLAEDPDGRLLGFAELSLRPSAEGCQSSPVAYLEGWFVLPDVRRQGVGRLLVAAGEAWGRSQGCTELASDTSPENEVSAAAHRSLGFDDVGMVRCFRKQR